MKILFLPLYGIGDTLMTTPALRILKRERPEWKVHVLTMFKATHDVLLRNPCVDEIIYFPLLSSRWQGLKFAFSLRGEYRITINPYPSNRRDYNILAYLIHAPYRLGHEYKQDNFKELNFLKNIRIMEDDSLHNVEENIRLLELLGIKSREKLPLELHLSPEEIAWGKRYLEERGIEGFLVGSHPGSSLFKYHTAKRWDKEKFKKLFDIILEERKDARILLFGGKEELGLREEIRKINPERMHVIDTKTVRETAAIMKNLSIFITNDSGVMHLAAACMVPIVAIFGPTNPGWVGPWGVPSRVVRLGLPCSPCFRYSPKPMICWAKRNYECMRKIEVEDVYRAYRSLTRELGI